MAYSTQKEFFHVPFMNETIEFECRKECVNLKRYASTYDDRSWANNESKQSRYLTDLVACRTHILGFEHELSDGDENYGERNVGTNKTGVADRIKASGSKHGEKGRLGGKAGAKDIERERDGNAKAKAADGIFGGGGVDYDQGVATGRGRLPGREGLTGREGLPGRDTLLIHDANLAMKRLDQMLLQNKKLEDQLQSTNEELSQAANERDELRKRLATFSEMERKVAELQKQSMQDKRDSIQLIQDLEKSDKYIENMEEELKKTEHFYEDKIKDFLNNENFLRAQISQLKHEMVDVKKENEELTYESCVLQAALDAYDCQYRQLMNVVEELQCACKQNQTAECLDDLAHFTTSTLIEIKKELENRKLCGMGDGNQLAEKNSEINRLLEEDLNLKHDCEELCGDLFKKLTNIKKENEILRNAYTECLNRNKEIMELVDEHKKSIGGIKIKMLDIDNILNKTSKESAQLEEDIIQSGSLVRDIKNVREENEEMKKTFDNLLETCQKENNELREKLRSSLEKPAEIRKQGLEEEPYTTKHSKITAAGAAETFIPEIQRQGRVDAKEKLTERQNATRNMKKRFSSVPPMGAIERSTSQSPDQESDNTKYAPTSVSPRRDSRTRRSASLSSGPKSDNKKYAPSSVSPRRGSSTEKPARKSSIRGSATERFSSPSVSQRRESAIERPIRQSTGRGSDISRSLSISPDRASKSRPTSQEGKRTARPAQKSPNRGSARFSSPSDSTRRESVVKRSTTQSLHQESASIKYKPSSISRIRENDIERPTPETATQGIATARFKPSSVLESAIERPTKESFVRQSEPSAVLTRQKSDDVIATARFVPSVASPPQVSTTKEMTSKSPAKESPYAPGVQKSTTASMTEPRDPVPERRTLSFRESETQTRPYTSSSRREFASQTDFSEPIIVEISQTTSQQDFILQGGDIVEQSRSLTSMQKVPLGKPTALKSELQNKVQTAIVTTSQPEDAVEKPMFGSSEQGYEAEKQSQQDVVLKPHMSVPANECITEKTLNSNLTDCSDTEELTFRNTATNRQCLEVQLKEILKECPGGQYEENLDYIDISEQTALNGKPLNSKERMKVELTKDAFNEFVSTHALQMKHKIRHGAGFTREVRAILDAFVAECGFCYCRDCVPKSKFYATCHQVLHYGIQNVSFKRLVYFHKQIYKIINNKKPGWLLQCLIEEQLGPDGLTCCNCKSTLCCTNSEDMLKEKVTKLERDIALARSYLDECKTYSSNTQLGNQCRESGGQDIVTKQKESTTYSIKSRFSTCRKVLGF